MRINSDHYGQIPAPSFILCRASGERIGSIPCTQKKMQQNFNTYDEISFTTYLYQDNQKNSLYDQISELKYIELPDIGRYLIGKIEIRSEGTQWEYKECTALSGEVILAQKYLEEFSINMGTAGSIDGVSLYNLSDPEKSLLHLVLEKCPDWEIGHVDNELYSVQRCFEITRQDIYSFLTENMAQAFHCIFDFDSLNHRIHIYRESAAGEDTDIFVSYQNLLKHTDISSSADDIKTCLTVSGADGLNLREVNMGYDRIYSLDYFHDLDYMSQGLYQAYEKWKKKWNDNVSAYESRMTQYQELYTQIHNLESEKLPAVSGSTNWSEYGLNPLKEQLAAWEGKQAVMIKAGQGAPTHKDYHSLYLPCYNTIQAIRSQIAQVESQIRRLQSEQKALGQQMDAILSSVSMQNNFTREQLKELTKYIREDELSSSNFVVTDTMTNAERMDMLHEMLEYGREELAKVSQPLLQFSCDLNNIFVIPKFRTLASHFEPGNYIHICLRDDYIVKARMLSLAVNFYDEKDFRVTFGNIRQLRKSKLFSDVTNALNLAKSAATSVSFHASHWNQANKDSSAIHKMLADGLLAAGQTLKTAQSDIVMDDRGMLVSNRQTSAYAGDTIFIGDGKILFSDDSLKTIKTALGRVQYTKKGVAYDDFGMLAQFVIAGFIAGSVVEGNEIIGGSVRSNNYVPGQYGTHLNLENGTFSFNGGGEKKLHFDGNTLTAKGTIQAESGYIGGADGFTIQSGRLYSGGKSAFSSSASGVYLGTDGISLGTGSPFHVDANGYLVSTRGLIGGFDITSKSISCGTSSLGTTPGSVYLGTDGISLGTTFQVTRSGTLTAAKGQIGGWQIHAGKLSSEGIDFSSSGHITSSNGNWRINADGTAVFKNVFVTGVQSGSNFGGLEYKNGVTSGNFSGNSYYGSNISQPFRGTAIPHIESLAVSQITADRVKAKALEAGFITADSIAANYATIGSLDAQKARIDDIEANYATIGSLDAQKARIDDIEASYITAETVEANYATIRSLNAVNAKFKNLDASNITSGKLSADRIDTEKITVGGWKLGNFHRMMVVTDVQQKEIEIMGVDGKPTSLYVLVGATYNPIDVPSIW
jgi:hypothetical protein